MANLGLGLIAADQYFKADDARKVREYEQAKRDAELSTLSDRTEADRSGYQLRTGQNRANSELLPGQTANARERLGLESADLQGQKERQPDEIKTKGTQAKIGLATVENDQANLPSSLQVKNNTLQGQLMTSNADLAQLPAKIQRAAVQGVLDQQGQSDVVLGTMGQLIARQDKAGAIAFANKIAQQGDILPNTNGKTFTDIQPVRGGPQGDGYNFVTSDGTSKFVPVQAIGAAMQKLKTGEYQFIHTNDGSVFAGNKTTGALTQAHQGDSKAARAQHTPAEVQTMEWLMGKGVAKDANQAWEMVRSAREKTRNAFIMDYVGKNALPGQDTNKLATDAGKIYDSLRPNQGPANPAPAPSNSPAASTMDPQIRSLLGLP